jgi:hypothetical protein
VRQLAAARDETGELICCGTRNAGGSGRNADSAVGVLLARWWLQVLQPRGWERRPSLRRPRLGTTRR